MSPECIQASRTPGNRTKEGQVMGQTEVKYYELHIHCDMFEVAGDDAAGVLRSQGWTWSHITRGHEANRLMFTRRTNALRGYEMAEEALTTAAGILVMGDHRIYRQKIEAVLYDERE